MLWVLSLLGSFADRLDDLNTWIYSTTAFCPRRYLRADRRNKPWTPLYRALAALCPTANSHLSTDNGTPLSELGVTPITLHPQMQVSQVGAMSIVSSSGVDTENPASESLNQAPGRIFPEPDIVFVSSSTCESEDIPKDLKVLLKRLKALGSTTVMKQADLQKMVDDIHDMGAQILLHDEEKHDTFDDGGIAIQTFVPFTKTTIYDTILCIETYMKTPENRGTQLEETESSNLKKFLRKPILKRLVPCKLSEKTNDNAHKSFISNLMQLHTKMRIVNFIAMPHDKPEPSTHSKKTDNILAISASIGTVSMAVFESVPVLATLKPVAGAMSGICTAVQTFRSNEDVAAKILYFVRDDIRWVIREIQNNISQREYTTEGPWELGRHVNDYFQRTKSKS
ncbi:hypothetical protein F5876DRAFT_70606 [Lentinula aff. lateritia]|uniref:Uncharacterized protein n=1 Tax=Lentinula aff. lateritia TaxID=2804960 RepID=A0ACC1TIQ2_9AGAR|nr:hypothetical protein F5876DRAFT_70606 [Lentinula aff. lateritia]